MHVIIPSWFAFVLASAPYGRAAGTRASHAGNVANEPSNLCFSNRQNMVSDHRPHLAVHPSRRIRVVAAWLEINVWVDGRVTAHTNRAHIHTHITVPPQSRPAMSRSQHTADRLNCRDCDETTSRGFQIMTANGCGAHGHHSRWRSLFDNKMYTTVSRDEPLESVPVCAFVWRKARHHLMMCVATTRTSITMFT